MCLFFLGGHHSPLPAFLGWGFVAQVSSSCCFPPVESTQSARVMVPLPGGRERLQATSGINSETSLLVWGWRKLKSVATSYRRQTVAVGDCHLAEAT